jgi:hypothetical protein
MASDLYDSRLHIKFIPLITATSLIFYPYYLLMEYAEEWALLITISILQYFKYSDS